MSEMYRKLNKSLLIRMEPNEKLLLQKFLSDNNLNAQQILRGYIKTLITTPGTPLYEIVEDQKHD